MCTGRIRCKPNRFPDFRVEWRLVTLRRVAKLLKPTLKGNDNPLNPGEGMEPHNVLWPIPQSQIDLNVDAEFSQNPGY